MVFEHLTQNKALATGSDTWFIPNPEASVWSSQIDWYLNYQIAKSEYRSTLKSKNNLMPKNIPLFIPTQNFLNNKSTICIHFENNISLWTLTISKIWDKLKTLSPRIFLPKNIKTEIFKIECQKLKITKDMKCSIVVDFI